MGRYRLSVFIVAIVVFLFVFSQEAQGKAVTAEEFLPQSAIEFRPGWDLQRYQSPEQPELLNLHEPLTFERGHVSLSVDAVAQVKEKVLLQFVLD